MNLKYYFIASCFMLSGGLSMLTSCTASHPLKEFTLENTLNVKREDETLVLTRTQLNPTDNTLQPVITNEQGEYIPCQLDDLDGDGEWDELAFVHTLAPSEKVKLKIQWIKPKEYPLFTPRTNVRYGKMTTPGVVEELAKDMHDKHNLPRGSEMYPYQMDGPAWENDKMGFRQYFDGRNCCDIFGKRIAEMVLDTVGINAEGNPANTYQVIRKWGGDILSVADSFGFGGLAMQTPDSLIRMGVPASFTEDVIDSTFYELVTEGPVRSIIRLKYEGWQINNNKINLCEEISIWAGKYGYEKKIQTSPLPQDYFLVSGIVSNLNTQPFMEEEYQGKQHAIMTHDQQTVNGSFYLGMGLLVPVTNLIETFHAPDENADIMKTWCVKMKPDANGEYKFRAYAAWEMRDKQFCKREAFAALIAHEAECINHPVVIHYK